jgi:hypothetical protein
MYIERREVRWEFRALAHLPLPLRRRGLYALYQRKSLRLRAPETFSEKVNWRIVNDRRAVVATACDKDASKDLARHRAGELLSVPSTYWLGRDVNELADVPLPDRWVMKPNSGSGRAIFGAGSPDVEQLKRQTDGWLDDDLNRIFGCWGYSAARNGFLVEDQIGDAGGELYDIKFYCFDGVPALIQVVGRAGNRHDFTHFSPQWEGLPTRIYARGRTSPSTSTMERPRKLGEMLRAASLIAQGFDFIRVDLYHIQEQIWFGELTAYPSGGVSSFHPPEADRQLGALWTLPSALTTGHRIPRSPAAGDY